MEFYLKVNTDFKTENKIAKKSIQEEDIELKTKKYTNKEIKDSVKFTLGTDENQAVLTGDCLVIFPSKYEGNTVFFCHYPAKS
jgi:hypothetical protein